MHMCLMKVHNFVLRFFLKFNYEFLLIPLYGLILFILIHKFSHSIKMSSSHLAC